MKALTVRQPYASLIAQGIKTIEVRSYPIKFRGEFVIHASIKPVPCYADMVKEKKYDLGKAICTVELADCRPLEINDNEAAWLVDDVEITNLYAWVLENPREIEHAPHKGKLSLWNFPDELIKYIK